MLSTRKIILLIMACGLLAGGCTAAVNPADGSDHTSLPPPPTSDQLMPPSTEPASQAALANPASVFCEQQGGKLEIRTAADGSQSGMCLFEDGSQCDEWAYFRGECAPGQGVETSSAGESPGYVNETHGFALNPPPDWTIEEHPGYLILNRPGYRIFIGYQWADEEPQPFRTGMPQGDLIDDGEASLLGQAVPKQILVFEGKNKVIAYNGRIKVGDLILVMYLDAVETDSTSYQELDIPPEVIAEADQIIASFKFNSGEKPEIEFNP